VRQPRQGELARAFRLLGTLGDGARPAPDQVLGLLGTLARIVASEFTTLSVCDLAAGRRFVSACPADPPGRIDHAAFDRLLAGHPLVRHHLRYPRARAVRLTDCVSDTDFQASELFRRYYGPLGLDRVALLPLVWEPGRLTGIVLNRAGRDFSDAEIGLLEAVRLQVTALYRQALAKACSDCAVGLLHGVAGSGRVGAITFDRHFDIVEASGPALGWLAEIARRSASPAPGSSLPVPVLQWLRAQVSEAAVCGQDRRSASLIDESSGARLVLHCLPRSCPSGCTLLIEGAEPSNRALAFTSRLTPRQTEILGWIAAGKTDECIAELLGVSRRTVGKHLQNMYRRLGVGNRTGAVMRALGR
jgi:DNA-binding CsgD family transcriptional regulator